MSTRTQAAGHRPGRTAGMTDVPRDAATELAWLTMEIDALTARLEQERASDTG